MVEISVSVRHEVLLFPSLFVSVSNGEDAPGCVIVIDIAYKTFRNTPCNCPSLRFPTGKVFNIE